MPGILNMLIGIALAGIGLLIMGAKFASALGGFFVVAYSAVVVGGIQLVFGLYQFVSYHVKGSDGKAKAHADAPTKAILQAMMATSFADGKIEGEEILKIADVYRQIFDSDLEVTWIRESANSMLKKDFDIATALGAKHKSMEPSLKPLILEAAYSVAAADGFLDEKERDILFAIARALQMTEKEIAAVSRKLEVFDAQIQSVWPLAARRAF